MKSSILTVVIPYGCWRKLKQIMVKAKMSQETAVDARLYSEDIFTSAVQTLTLAIIYLLWTSHGAAILSRTSILAIKMFE